MKKRDPDSEREGEGEKAQKTQQQPQPQQVCALSLLFARMLNAAEAKMTLNCVCCCCCCCYFCCCCCRCGCRWCCCTAAAVVVVVIFVVARNYMAIKLIELRASRSRQLLRLSSAQRATCHNPQHKTKYAQQVQRHAANSCNSPHHPPLLSAFYLSLIYLLLGFFGIISCRRRVAHFAVLILAPEQPDKIVRQTDRQTDGRTDRGGSLADRCKWHRQLRIEYITQQPQPRVQPSE